MCLWTVVVGEDVKGMTVMHPRVGHLFMPESRREGRKKACFISLKTVWGQRTISIQSWTHKVASHLQIQEVLKSNQAKQKLRTWGWWEKDPIEQGKGNYVKESEKRRNVILKIMCERNQKMVLKIVWHSQ